VTVSVPVAHGDWVVAVREKQKRSEQRYSLVNAPDWPPVPLMTPPLLRHQRRYGVSDPHLAAPRGCDTPPRLTLVNESESPFSSREERIAFNEAWCRDLNERKADWMRSGLPTAGFRCECGQMNCGSRLPLSASAWEEARSRPNRFAVAPGHVAPDVEAVVKQYSDFWLVEKQGEAGDIVEELT
jgi:hypothetical protein